MKKVLVIAYYFPPLGWSGVQRTLKFVKYLLDFGWEPTVVTVGDTRFSIRDESLVEEIPSEIKVIQVGDLFLKGVTDTMLQQLLELVQPAYDLIEDEQLKNDYLQQLQVKMAELRNLVLLPDGNMIWAKNAIDQIKQELDLSQFDLIYSTSGPYSDHIVGYYLKKESGLPWVADFRDEWTNNGYYDFDQESIRYQVEKELEHKIVHAADQILTVTPFSTANYQKLFGLSPTKVTTITNGYDEEDFLDIEVVTNRDKFTIVHNGTFYLQRNPLTFMKALENLIYTKQIPEEKIEIELIGKVEPNIKAEVKKMSVNSLIKWVSYLPHKESLTRAIQADLLLLVIGSGEQVKPIYTGKVFEYLRLGKPILSLSPKGSVVDHLLQETGHGYNVEYDNIREIEEKILKFYQDWETGKRLTFNQEAIQKYERKHLTHKLVTVFHQLLESN